MATQHSLILIAVIVLTFSISQHFISKHVKRISQRIQCNSSWLQLYMKFFVFCGPSHLCRCDGPILGPTLHLGAFGLKVNGLRLCQRAAAAWSEILMPAVGSITMMINEPHMHNRQPCL
ncbi:uncharacterized protein LY89DRAFT_501180 [Mollisia scopiformis]|uniref:Uncharacterized protein n=1 Tax=Mollisia scopiformis TaxID=149040 RepID=A0A194XET0_MOLSC|nr:uncharacterized protein LY89DRAFT_501180 [Mollisia scopiformis]KUJ18649.1 hypothetical protein LY89DRAFT_501180 [Mollisia scopiformis]